MAKSLPKNGTSKVRLIVFEAEVSDGDLSQFTHAIQNALRPAQSLAPRVVQIAPPSPAEANLAINGEEDGLDVDLEAEEQLTRRASSQRSRKATFRTPQVVEVDLKSEPSLESFMRERPPKNTNSKYLAVLAWFKEARNIDSVDVDQVYTCFKQLGWSTAIKDFSQPLRDLKGQQLIGGNAKDGFVINHLGLDKVGKFSEAK